MMTPVKQRKVSARYYLFEDLLWEMPGFVGLKRPIAIADLQAYAAFIWAKEKGPGICPTVGAISNTRKTSYYCSPWEGKPGSIHLVPKHQNLAGLLHELAHALGPRDRLTHGPAFRKRCIRLYREYGDWDGKVDWDRG